MIYKFYACSDLTNVILSNGVSSIGIYAFNGCANLVEVIIPNSLTSIGVGIFSDCNALEQITVEEDNPYFDSRDNCNAIIRTADNELVVGCKATSIPNSVTSIGKYAFYFCSAMTKLTIPHSVVSIDDFAFENCSGLTELVIPNSVTSIGIATFRRCSGLTSLTIPNSLSSITNSAFAWCTGLTSVTIPNGVASIDYSAFQYCTGLIEVTIPRSVTSISYYAFQYCISLASIISLNTTPPEIQNGTFETRVEQNATLHVPAGCKTVYKQAPYWQNFFNIQEDAIDGIKPAITEKLNAPSIYTLDGKRLPMTNAAELPKGIYVINGKKVIVK